MRVLISTLAVLALSALPAEAQLRVLQISNGRVTLDASNVPAQQILSEWARIGGTKIVGGEKIVGAPLTLRLVDMPEKQALDIILRNVAGFMAAPRQASAVPGASTYDRILIMATSSAPAPAPTAARGAAPRAGFGNQMNGVQRRVPPRPPSLPPVGGDDPPMEDDQGNIVEQQPEPASNEPPVFTFPSPNSPAQGGNTVFVPMPGSQGEVSPGAVTAPVITLQPGTNGPTIYNFVPTDGTGAPAQPAPAGAFGVIGAPTPGMIQVPAPPPTPATRVPPRPPGGN
jgi:hypothetical protein